MVDLQTNLNDIAIRYDKDIIVVETSYAFTADDNDNYENIIRFEEHPGYPFSPESQRQMLANIMMIVRAVPNGRTDAAWVSCGGTPPGPLSLETVGIPRTRLLETIGRIKRYLITITGLCQHGVYSINRKR